jgi:hypothetical protein
MDPTPLLRSVRNNARWCDRVCAAHGRPGDYASLAWCQRRPSPPYYPNLVTLAPAADRRRLAPVLAQLASPRGPGAHAVKDSFARLDLAGDGYDLLFEASWVWREPAGGSVGGDRAPFQWSRVRSRADLRAWEAAWRSQSGLPAGEAAPALYPASLLRIPGLTFLAGCHEGRTVAGCAVTRANGVLGLACIFPGPAGHPEVVASLAAHLEANCPGLPLAGYESGADLECLRACGFRELGPLRVWLRDTGPS